MIDPYDEFTFQVDPASSTRPPFEAGDYTFCVTDFKRGTYKGEPCENLSISVLNTEGNPIGSSQVLFTNGWPWKRDAFTVSLGIYPNAEGKYSLRPEVIRGMHGRARFKAKLMDNGVVFPDVAKFLPAPSTQKGF